MKRILAFLLPAMLLFTACNTKQPSSGNNASWSPASLPPLGIIEDNTYTSTVLNLRFDGTPAWNLLTREELDMTNADFQTTGLYVDMLAETAEEHMLVIGGSALVAVHFVPYSPNPNAFTVPEELEWYVDLMNTYNAEDPADVMGYDIAGTTYFYYEDERVEGYTQYYFLTPADENYMLIISVSLPQGMSIHEVTDQFTTINLLN